MYSCRRRSAIKGPADSGAGPIHREARGAASQTCYKKILNVFKTFERMFLRIITLLYSHLLVISNYVHVLIAVGIGYMYVFIVDKPKPRAASKGKSWVHPCLQTWSERLHKRHSHDNFDTIMLICKRRMFGQLVQLVTTGRRSTDIILFPQDETSQAATGLS